MQNLVGLVSQWLGPGFEGGLKKRPFGPQYENSPSFPSILSLANRRSSNNKGNANLATPAMKPSVSPEILFKGSNVSPRVGVGVGGFLTLKCSRFTCISSYLAGG